MRSVKQISRILNLRLLAPAIQEKLLFLPEVTSGNDDIHLADMAKVWRERDWERLGELLEGRANVQGLALSASVLPSTAG